MIICLVRLILQNCAVLLKLEFCRVYVLIDKKLECVLVVIESFDFFYVAEKSNDF